MFECYINGYYVCKVLDNSGRYRVYEKAYGEYESIGTFTNLEEVKKFLEV